MHTELQPFHAIYRQCRESEVVVVILRNLTEIEGLIARTTRCNIGVIGCLSAQRCTIRQTTGAGRIALEVLLIGESLEFAEGLEGLRIAPSAGTLQCLINRLNIDIIGRVAIQTGQSLVLHVQLPVEDVCCSSSRFIQFCRTYFEVPLVLGFALCPRDIRTDRINILYLNRGNLTAERHFLNHQVIEADMNSLVNGSIRRADSYSAALAGIGTEVYKDFVPCFYITQVEAILRDLDKVVISLQYTNLGIGSIAYIRRTKRAGIHRELQGLDRFVKHRQYQHRLFVRRSAIEFYTVTGLDRCIR